MKCPHCGADRCRLHNRVTRDPVWLTFIALLLAADACMLYRDGSIVGGNDPITVDCHDGTTCPENYSCPAPGGRCEWVGPGIETGERSVCGDRSKAPCTYCMCMHGDGGLEQCAAVCR